MPGWVSHLELDGQTRDRFGWTEIVRRAFFVTMDRRGTGLSGRDIEDYSIEARESDLAAVVNDLGLKRFVLAGWSEGGPTAISFTAHHPELVSELIIVGSFANAAKVGGSKKRWARRCSPS